MRSPTSSESELATADFERLAEQVDQAVAEVRGLPEDARRRAYALKSAVEAVHKVGLTRIVTTLKADPRGKELLFDLVDDPAVRMLFVMHGLIRADLRTRAERVIEMVRPHVRSHGGDVTLVDVRDGVAYVRLSGSCTGCSMSAVTLRATVEEAFTQQCPEITAVQPAPDDPASPGLVQLGLLTRPDDLAAGGWVAGPAVSDLKENRAVMMDTPLASVVLVKAAGGIRAYRNACAHQGLPLDGGLVDPETNTLTCPWHGFRFDCDTGECLTTPAAQLEQFPMRVEKGLVWVRPT